MTMASRVASFVEVRHCGRRHLYSPSVHSSIILRTQTQKETDLSQNSVAALTPSWNDYFQALVEFRNEKGTTNVPKRHVTTISISSSTESISIQLGAWVSRQRQRKDRLHASQISALDSIGFCWNAEDDKKVKVNQQWWERFHDIQETRQKILSAAGGAAQHNVPLEESLSASQLSWLRRQRNDYHDHYQLHYTTSCKLNEDQLQALSQLDPEWYKTPRERQWQAQFRALQEFQKEHGHCNVPISHKNKKLANWVQTTRKKYKAIKLSQQSTSHHEHHLPMSNTKSLTKEQEAMLDEIGFDYDPWGHYS